MALGATIHKVKLSVADIDRGYYADHALTVARHPSETEERMMVRLFAFALHADETLQFGRGLSTDDEPDLWRIDATGAIRHWIELGQPDPKWLRKAASRADRVELIGYGARFDLWWTQQSETLSRLPTLTVRSLPAEQTRALAAMAARSMDLSVTIQQGGAWIVQGERSIEMNWSVLKESRDEG